MRDVTEMEKMRFEEVLFLPLPTTSILCVAYSSKPITSCWGIREGRKKGRESEGSVQVAENKV